jgi:hypothetical protein
MSDKQKWTDELVLQVISECRQAGQLAAKQQLERLQASGPAFNVVDDMQPNKPIVGQLLDVCGGAWLKISARGKFFKIAKRLSADDNYRFWCRVGLYPKGGSLSIFDCSMRQEMSVNIAANKAMKDVLAKYDIEARVYSFID